MALATLTDVQEIVKIDGGAQAHVTNLLAAANQWALDYIGCDLAQASHTERLSGDGTRLLYPSYWPVTAVTSVVVENIGLTLSVIDYNDTTDSSQDVFLPEHGMFLVMRAVGETVYGLGVWPRGYGNIKITYTAGYATIPERVRRAVAQLTLLMRYEEDKIGKDDFSRGDRNATRVLRKVSDHPSVIEALDAYRRVRVG